MWLFKKQDKPEPVPRAPINPRQCWCGSVNFGMRGDGSEHRWCTECGTVFVGRFDAKNPCGAEDLRNKTDKA